MNAQNNSPLLPLPISSDLDSSFQASNVGQEGTRMLLQAQTNWMALAGIPAPQNEIAVLIDEQKLPR
jgi:hypothetical protein